MLKDNTKDLVGIKEVAKMLGISEYKLRQGVKNGKYPSFRIGHSNGKIMFDAEAIKLFIPDRKVSQKGYELGADMFEDPDDFFIYSNYIIESK